MGWRFFLAAVNLFFAITHVPTRTPGDAWLVIIESFIAGACVVAAITTRES